MLLATILGQGLSRPPSAADRIRSEDNERAGAERRTRASRVKRSRTPEKAERDKRISKAEANAGTAAVDDATAIWESLFNDLSTKRARRCGDRHKP